MTCLRGIIYSIIAQIHVRLSAHRAINYQSETILKQTSVKRSLEVMATKRAEVASLSDAISNRQLEQNVKEAVVAVP
jgi:hypothetical protein